MRGVPEVEGGDFASKGASPEREWSVGSIGDGSSGDLTLMGDDDLFLVKGNDGGGVAESEFMEGFDGGKKRHGEEEHFGVIEGAKDFLELGHGGEKDEVVFFDETGDVGGEEVDGVTGEKNGLGGGLEGFGESDGGGGIFGEFASAEDKVSILSGIVQDGGLVEGA